MDNNINFRGTFYINKSTPAIKKAISPILKKKDIIFENVKNKDDILYVVSDNADRKIANIIVSEPGISFNYYPALNRTSGFNKNDKEGAIKLLMDAAKTVINTKTKLLNAIRKPVDTRQANIMRIQERNLKTILSETFLDIKNGDYQKHTNVKSGVLTLKTKVFDRKTKKMRTHTLIEMTPPGKFGICYVKYRPLSEKERVRKIALQNGEKILEYTAISDGTFSRYSNAAKRQYKKYAKLINL